VSLNNKNLNEDTKDLGKAEKLEQMLTIGQMRKADTIEELIRAC